MNINIKVINRELNVEEKANIRYVSYEELDKVMELQEKIVEWLPNKELYAASTKEEFEKFVEEKGKIVGFFNPEDKLIAMGVYCILGVDKDNYGYDIELSNEEVLKTSQIESTMVHKDYRGNKLQNIVCKIIENLSIEDKMERVMATVSPENPYSLNTFLNSGFEIKKEKLKYGGLKRAILEKKLEN